MTLYLVLKLVHVLAAIVAVGFNLTYVVWLFRGGKDQSHLLFALKGIKWMDDRVANPSYIVALLSGLALAHLGNYSLLSVSWIFYPLILFAILGAIGFGIYTPLLAHQIRILESEGPGSEAYRQIDRKQTVTGAILFTLALTIVAIMVLKPSWPVL